MSSTILLDSTTKTGCTVRLLRANHGEHDHLGHGLMLTLDMGQPDDRRHAEVYLDGYAAEDIYAALGLWLKGPEPE